MANVMDEFRLRASLLFRHLMQTPPMAACGGAYNDMALQAARNICERVLSAADAAALGNLGDPLCLLCADVTPLAHSAAPLRVPMDSIDGAMAVLRLPSCIRLNGVGTSLENVARIMLSPTNAQLIEDMARRDTGIGALWRGPVLGCIDDCRQAVDNLMAGQTHEAQGAAIICVMSTLQRFALWLIELKLPSPTDVLMTWTAAQPMPRLSQAEAHAMLAAATRPEWEYCAEQLFGWMETQCSAAIDAIMRNLTVGGGASMMPVMHLVHASLQTLATRYLRMRYLSATHLCAAMRAVHNYLTCSTRVAYTSMTPGAALVRTPTDTAKYVFSSSPSTAATCSVPNMSFVGRVLQRTATLGVIAETLSNAAREQLLRTIDNAAAGLFVAFAWRWTYIGHIVPMLAPRLHRNDHMCASLTVFTRPDTPAAYIGVGEYPRLAEVMRSYLAYAWHTHVNVIERCVTLSLQIPFGGEPLLPTAIVGRQPVAAAAVLLESDSDSESDDAAADVRAQRDNTARRFNRRQHTLLDTKPRKVRHSVSSLPSDSWGTAMANVASKVPRIRSSRVKVAPAAPDDVLPPVALDMCIPAMMPPCRQAPPPIMLENSSTVREYLVRMTDMHTLPGPAPDSAEHVYVRPRQLLALITYWINQCQSTAPGILVATRLRSTLASHIARHANVNKSRKRALRINRQSFLHPLGVRMLATQHAMRRRTNVVDMIMDSCATTPILHGHN